jgi:plasmid stabilization system protein ParE
MGRFRLSRRAEVDLLSIGDYTLHKWGKIQAARYIGELEVYCQTLADNPALGLCDHVRPGLHRHEPGTHVLFYRRSAVALWFLASCINACCPTDTPSTAKTKRSKEADMPARFMFDCSLPLF